jgi:hypothetical protein
MTWYDWNETARGLARQVRQFPTTVERGAVPLRLLDESTRPPRFVDDGPLVLGVFGNDAYLADERARHAVAWLRQRLKDTEARELGFGVSDDGQTWALLVGTDKSRYKTAAGQRLQRELLKVFLDEAVWQAWQHAGTTGARAPGRDSLAQGLALLG